MTRILSTAALLIAVTGPALAGSITMELPHLTFPSEPVTTQGACSPSTIATCEAEKG
ncbi:hypothetical protein ACFE33_02210 [Falsihalocynthiibacter sp. SS001]|uniref:hypothetical protein n=1 Tax=Falsihalocynthiibacter sp. SS001 TaxID=3349698 RepID=UPI0036D3319A